MSRVGPWLLLAAAGCAWSNPANRPVWNAYEHHLVPDGGAAFWATLPLTAPAGMAAIVADTLLVHPVRVLDDAAGDAADRWRRAKWRDHYYTELAFAPFRAALTPVVFAGSFLGRAMFDVPPRGMRRTQEPAATAAADPRDRAQWLERLASLARQEPAPSERMPAAPPWDDELAQAFDRALRTADGRGRHWLFREGSRAGLPPLVREPWLGLRDADPVVRYLELLAWDPGQSLPTGLRDDLLADPNEMVRLLAEERLR
jgi:hypothetical protein